MPARFVREMKAKSKGRGDFLWDLRYSPDAGRLRVKVASEDVKTSVEEDVSVPKKGNKPLLVT